MTLGKAISLGLTYLLVKLCKLRGIYRVPKKKVGLMICNFMLLYLRFLTTLRDVFVLKKKFGHEIIRENNNLCLDEVHNKLIMNCVLKNVLKVLYNLVTKAFSRVGGPTPLSRGVEG